MKAVVYTAPLTLELQDIPEPVAGNGDRIVDVEAVGICGSELEGFASKSPFRVPPLIMGHEFAGRARDTGDRVVINPLVTCGTCALCEMGRPNICKNRRIIGIHSPGGFAESVAVPSSNLIAIPESLEASQAAMIEPLANAIHAMGLAQQADSHIRRIGVIGAGTLGVMTAVVAESLGLEVDVADLSDERLAVAQDAGANTVGAELGERYDVVFDTVGNRATRGLSVERLRLGGSAVWIGLHEPEAALDSMALIRTEKRILGTFCYHGSDYRRAIRLAERIDPTWTRSVPLEEAVDAFWGLTKSVPPEIKTVILP